MSTMAERARCVTERLRHTRDEIVGPLCRQHNAVYEENYHAGGIDRAIELIAELLVAERPDKDQ